MKHIFALAAVLFTASAAAQSTTIKPGAVTSAVAPKSSPPPGCSENYDGVFEIGPINVTSSSSKRSLLEVRQTQNTQLGITLKNGILTDPLGRTGYIASNQQFQFDGPPQAGAIWTAGFSVCQNGSLALGSDVFWWKCLSGTFYNLYFETQGGQCIESYIIAYGLDGGHPLPASAAASSATGAASASSSSSSSAPASSSSSAAATTKTSVKTTTAPKSTNTQANASSASSAASSTTSAAGAVRTNSLEGALLGLAGGVAALVMI